MSEPIEITNMRENSENREYVIKAVKEDGKLLEFADEKLREDKEIGLAAMNKNKDCFEFLGPNLKNDEEILAILNG